MHAVICDDHRIFVESLAVLLEANGHDIVACASTPEEARAAVAAHRPDICLMDLVFPSGERVDGVRAVKEVSPATHVVVLSGFADARVDRRVRHAGATACIPKDCDVEVLARHLEAVCARDPRALARCHAGAPAGGATDGWDAHPLARFLTGREREVLQGLVNGDTTKQLARRLAIGPATVRTHIQSVLGKLGVHSRLEAVAVAIGASLVRPEWPDGHHLDRAG